jgi:hypothetical protein
MQAWKPLCGVDLVWIYNELKALTVCCLVVCMFGCLVDWLFACPVQRHYSYSLNNRKPMTIYRKIDAAARDDRSAWRGKGLDENTFLTISSPSTMPLDSRTLTKSLEM